MKDNYKVVYFEKYCNKCLYSKKPESEDPCRECLEVPARNNSHKPSKFIKK